MRSNGFAEAAAAFILYSALPSPAMSSLTAPNNQSAAAAPPPSSSSSSAPVSSSVSSSASRRSSRPQGWRRDANRPRITAASVLKADQQKHRDALPRMNFLYQAAHYYSHFLSDSSVNSPLDPHRSLARFYATTMKKMSTRLVIRLDSSIKNSICKRCNSVLVPGPLVPAPVSVSASDSSSSSSAQSSSPAHFGSCVVQVHDADEYGTETPLIQKICLTCGSANTANLRRELRSRAVNDFHRQRRKHRKKQIQKDKKLNQSQQPKSENTTEINVIMSENPTESVVSTSLSI